jgi:hypothetical protein
MRIERSRRLQGMQLWKTLHQKVQNEMVESERPVDPPEKLQLAERDQLGSGTPCRKLKDLQLPKALLERARDHTSFPAMWH